MRNSRIAKIILAGALLTAAIAWSDSLELKNGSLIKGRYMGGSEREVSFQVGSTTQTYSTSDIVSLTFDSPSRSSNTNNSGNSAPTLAPRANREQLADTRPPRSNVSGRTINIPAGTRLLVRTVDAVDSDKNKVGDKFSANLDQPLVIDDVIVAPKGTDIYGRLSDAQEAGHFTGKAQLKLELTGIVINGQTMPLVTGNYELSGSGRGSNTAKKVGGGAAVGALIGAIAGGGKGAAIGAGVGAGAGTAVQIATKGEQVHVPSETLLEFTVDQPTSLPIAN